MSQPLLTENLTKTYQLGKKKLPKTALDSLNIEVPEGIIFGFLGPNGAGKTTTIKLMLDFVQPTSGSATIFGHPTTASSARSLIGYLPEQPYFHKFLKPIEVLSMHAVLAGVDRREIRKRAISCLERAGLSDYIETPIAKLSKGLTQRVGIAQAIVGDPKLLILDEPASGLDPIGRHQMRDLLLDLKNEGKTIFLSSHLLSEVESICDKVAVLKKGKMVAMGAPDSVRSSSSHVVIHTSPIDQDMLERLRFLNVSINRQSDCTVLTIDPKAIYEVMRAMEEIHLPVYKIDTQRESLEEAFLRLAA
ncbi:MAG: ABC transporter ATP-binding protein [Armatimonadota bacterium]|nr:ABC transporter ATP-binding protein [bacterium]